MFLDLDSTERQNMKVSIECDDEWEARGMLNWHKYRSTCEEIREHLRSRLKYGDVNDDVYRELQSIQSLLYPHEEES